MLALTCAEAALELRPLRAILGVQSVTIYFLEADLA